MRAGRIVFLAIFACLFLLGCRSAYYAAWETLGKEKRHLLRSNVEKARTEQKEAAEQFKDAFLKSFEG